MAVTSQATWTAPPRAVSPEGDACNLGTLLERVRANTVCTVSWLAEGKVFTRSFADFAADVDGAEARLRASGASPGMRIGIVAANSYAWLVYDLAALKTGAVLVAFPEEMSSISSHDLATEWSLGLLLREASSTGPRERYDLTLDGHDHATARRMSLPTAADPPPLSLIFSSGSEGRLKCMEVDRGGVEEMVDEIAAVFPPSPGDRALLFLPLSNFQQRVFAYAAFWLGIDVAVIRPADLFRGLARLRPTIVVAPPLLFQTIENQVRAVRGLKGATLHLLGWLCQRAPIRWRRRLQRRLFRKVHDALGGRIRFMITGMAPISPLTLNRFAHMGLELYEAYGLTECGIVAWNTQRANKIGSVGKPAPGSQITIAPDGEVIVRKRRLATRGYVGSESTRGVYLGNGAIATGDLGRFDDEGYLHLIGRKKEIIVTAGGHKISPERLEVRLSEIHGVARSIAWGSQDRDGHGVVRGIDLLVSTSMAPDMLRSTVMDFVRELNTELPTDARVRRVWLTEEQLTVENGLLTRNMKVDRRRAVERYAATVDRLGAVV